MLCASTSAAQSPPPIHGVTGKLALEGTVKKVYGGVNTIVVDTIDGVEHVFHYTRKLLAHGPKGSNENPVEQFKEGSWVVVHYTNDGDRQNAQEVDGVDRAEIVDADNLRTTEGVVARINRRRQEITIRYPDGKTEKLRLTDRAAADSGNDVRGDSEGGDPGDKVVVYYKDEKGGKVAHYFKKVS
jgi:hypothetical protein